MISNQLTKKNNAATSYNTGLLHSYAAVINTLRRFFETIDLLVLKRDYYNKEREMRKSRTTPLKKTLLEIDLIRDTDEIDASITDIFSLVSFLMNRK